VISKKSIIGAIALAFVTPCLVYMLFPGNFSGGGIIHIPPSPAASDAIIYFTLETAVTGSGSKDVSRRYSGVSLAYSAESGGVAMVAMALVEASGNKGIWRVPLTREAVESAENFQYWFEFSLDSHRQKSKLYNLSP